MRKSEKEEIPQIHKDILSFKNPPMQAVIDEMKNVGKMEFKVFETGLDVALKREKRKLKKKPFNEMIKVGNKLKKKYYPCDDRKKLFNKNKTIHIRAIVDLNQIVVKFWLYSKQRWEYDILSDWELKMLHDKDMLFYKGKSK